MTFELEGTTYRVEADGTHESQYKVHIGGILAGFFHVGAHGVVSTRGRFINILESNEVLLRVAYYFVAMREREVASAMCRCAWSA
jgi:hypothetical protein